MASTFGVREVEKLLGLPGSAIRGLVRAGFVTPSRGPRREYRFTFQDLIVLRTARALSAAKVPPRRITRSLKLLRSRLPETVPLSGLRISALGDRVVVSEGGGTWRAETGQYLLDLDVSVDDGAFAVEARELKPPRAAPPAGAEHWLDRAIKLEESDRDEACAAYRRALKLDPELVGARINLGRLLHEAGRKRSAELVYRAGLSEAGSDPTLLFNLGVLLEDMGRRSEAITTYEAALRADPRFADCHYNLALAYEAEGNARGAIRHMREYRKLAR